VAPILLIGLLLWLPGALLHRGLGIARGPWGTGLLAVEASLSLAFLSLVLLPVYLARAPLALAPIATLAATLALAVLATRQRRTARAATDRNLSGAAGAREIVCFVVAVALLLPATLGYCGANVDDWWDLSFVRGWLADGRFGFAVMALSPDPASPAPDLHPRFLWSVWLMLQAMVSWVTGEQPWRIQAGGLAAVVCVLLVSAQAALARALFRASGRAPHLVAATLAMTAPWIWGSEALPLFVRAYQDKLFAGFVLAPVLLALVLDASAHDNDAAEANAYGRRPRGDAMAVGAAALATVSVHSLVFTMAAFVAVVAVVARRGGGAVAWLRAHPGVAAALVVPAVYPLSQALMLASTFGEQGISLAARDNPVVRAHLALGRLVAVGTPAWIVHPGAVFGTIAMLALVGLALAWRRRRHEDHARVLLAITLVPCALLFVPGLAALAGKLWVPWMLYRLGWLVPVAPLLGYALVRLGRPPSPLRARPVSAALLAAAVVLVAGSTAADRLRRDMSEHPEAPAGTSAGAPTAAAAVVYDFLGAREGRDPVLAPPNFSELLPALSGKPVVAFPERGSLVFSTDEASAYRRLRDRAVFYAASTSAAARDEVARRYGVRWAVLPRRLVASGSESAWLWRYGPEALLAARAADAREGDAEDGEPCRDGFCRGWWSATRECAIAGLTGNWTLVLETRDYFVAERATSGGQDDVAEAATGRSPAVAAGREREDADATPQWLRPFVLIPASVAPANAAVLATVTGQPGAVVGYDVPPRYTMSSVLPVWIEGPGAWEDAPSDAAISLDLGVACRLTAVVVIPHLPRERREVLEVRVGERRLRMPARHGIALVLALDDAEPRSRVTVRVSSLLGMPVSVADVRLLGDPASCAPGWPVHTKTRTPQMSAPADALLDLATALPPGARALVSLAHRAERTRGHDAAAALLREATRREPSLVEAWLDLGFTEDARAESATSPEAAEAARAAARVAFDGAVAADSNSAWAQGSAAWSARRDERTLVAIRQALIAADLDARYGDAWTILAYAFGDLRLYALAERALQLAEDEDPERNWPALARADLALHRGDPVAARAALRAWILKHPFDVAARDKLSQIAASTAAAPASGGEEAKP